MKHVIQLVKTDGIQGFQFGNQKKKREISAQQQWSTAHSKLKTEFEARRSNVIWLVTVECSKSCDTISFVKLNCSLEHFNWPSSMRANLGVEKRSFYYEAD